MKNIFKPYSNNFSQKFPSPDSKSLPHSKAIKVDPALKELNSLIPDFLQGKPSKASRQIFERNISSKLHQKNEQNSINLNDFDKLTWSDNQSDKNEFFQPLKSNFSGFLDEKEIKPFEKPYIPSNPLEYYQNFKVNNLNNIDTLEQNQYMVKQRLESKPNETFYSDENVEQAKYINFDKENLIFQEFHQINPEQEPVIEDMIEISSLFNDFNSLSDKPLSDYDKILINIEEYDNVIAKKRQNHASFAFISLSFLRKMLRKFLVGCECLKSHLKAQKILPQIPFIFSMTFQNLIKKIKNFDLNTQDLDILLNLEGPFYTKINVLANNLQTLQKILNLSKVLYSSLSSLRKNQSNLPIEQEKKINIEVKTSPISKNSFKNQDSSKKYLYTPKKSNHDFLNPKSELQTPIINSNNIRNGSINIDDSRLENKKLTQLSPLNILHSFLEMKNLLLNLLNIIFNQKLTEENLKDRLLEKDEGLNEKEERIINTKKSDEIISFVKKAWGIYTFSKEEFANLELQYLNSLKLLMEKIETSYYKYFSIYQKLSFSMESLRKLCQLNLEEMHVLEIETNEILEKTILKLQFPLSRNEKSNEKVFATIYEKREKLLNKVLKLKKETKTMKKNLRNDFFYLLYMRKCEESLLKVSRIQHQLKAFSELLHLLKEYQLLEKTISKENFLNKNISELDSEDPNFLKTKRKQYICIYQTLIPYKNKVGYLKKSFPSFFEIEKEINREIEALDTKLKRVNEILEGKSPEILELLDQEIEVSQLLAEKLGKLLVPELKLKDYLLKITKNSGLQVELSKKTEVLQRFMLIHGLQNSKKKQLGHLSEEIHRFQTCFTQGEAIYRIIERLKPENIKKLFVGVDIKRLFEVEEHKKENLETCLKEIDYDLGLLKKVNNNFSEEILSKDSVLSNIIAYKEILGIILQDYLNVSEKIKSGYMCSETEYQIKSKELTLEIDGYLQQIMINKLNSEFFIQSQELKTIIAKYFKDNQALIGNQNNSLLKLTRKNRSFEYKDLLFKYKENFLVKGIKVHTLEKLEEMSKMMKQAKELRNEIKTEVLQQKQVLSKEKSQNYSFDEVKELVFSLNGFIKGCLFMISLGGMKELFTRKLKDIQNCFHKTDEFTIVIPQKIKETATDIHQIKKKIKSSKIYLPPDFKEIYSEAIEIIDLTTDSLSIIYEIIGDLNAFDSVFNENGFEINAKSPEFHDALLIFLKFFSTYYNKKKNLIENRQKLSIKITNEELKEIPKPLEGINVQLFKLIEQYGDSFDLEFLSFLEPKLKLMNERNIMRLSKQLSNFLEIFHCKIKEELKYSGKILDYLNVELPKISEQIKNIIEIFETDLSYKGFMKNPNKKTNAKANKMLSVEGLAECKAIFQKEKLANWASILSYCWNVSLSYLKDKRDANLKNLTDYRNLLFSLKKSNHSSNKEMTFINTFEELLIYDIKIALSG